MNEALDVDPGPAATWDVTAVSQDDVAAVRAFLERRPALQGEYRVQIAAELASRLRPRVGGAPPNLRRRAVPRAAGGDEDGPASR